MIKGVEVSIWSYFQGRVIVPGISGWNLGRVSWPDDEGIDALHVLQDIAGGANGCVIANCTD